MSGARRNRLERLEARNPAPPPAPPPGMPTEDELRRMTQDELLAAFEARVALWERSPEGRRRAAEIAAMSDEELVAEWERMPRFRDTPRGRRR